MCCVNVFDLCSRKYELIISFILNDQFDVGAKIAERGAAKVLSKWAKADDIYNAIVEVRDNPK